MVTACQVTCRHSIAPMTPEERWERSFLKRLAKLRRQENRLIREGMSRAGEERVHVLRPPCDQEGMLDATAFVELARSRLPSLYRRTMVLRERLTKEWEARENRS